MNKAHLILITGATGAVGPLVVKALHAAGYSIRTLSLDPPPAGIWPDNVETQIGDVTEASDVQSAMQGVDAVIHLAALLHIVNPPPALQKKYEQINVGGTSTVVDEAIKAGVKRVVLFSTIAVYGPSNGRILTEDTPPCPDTFYAQTKLAAEKIVLDAKGADGGQIGTVLRLGAVYGSRIKGNYQRLVQALAGNLGTRSQFLAKLGHVPSPKLPFIPVGNGFNRRTLVYDKDVARAAVLALEHPDAAGKIFNVSDGEFHPLNDIISTMCQALGRKPPWIVWPGNLGTRYQFLAKLGHVPRLPVGPVRFAAGIVEDMARLVGRQPPIMRATIDKYTEDVAVDSQRIQDELGFVPCYNLAAGWKETVQEMRKMEND
jgi:UDP-glucose 4-epimerase